MAGISVLVEIRSKEESAFEMHRSALESMDESTRMVEDLGSSLSGLGMELSGDFAPVPMFAKKVVDDRTRGFEAFGSTEENDDVESASFVIAATIDDSRVEELRDRRGVRGVWPNSEMTYHARSRRTRFGKGTTTIEAGCGIAPQGAPIDLARSSLAVDCFPVKPAVDIATIRELLGVQRIWTDGFRGQNIIVGIIDEGVSSDFYPVVGGFAREDAQQPGTASVQSHGSMCAADVLVAAPAAKLYDYPFLGVPDSGGALTMFQAVLDQRRIDGTPQVVTNSYGFTSRPSKIQFPGHEVWDIDHPLHRKVREVVASGCTTLFSAGNCGVNCPDGRCLSSGIGPGKSIHASNSLKEVITVAAVNSLHDRVGYSSQGPGGFEDEKPDVTCYTHFFGNSGPGRPAGGDEADFDSGTSASTPVVAGVAALLLSAFNDLTPGEIKQALIDGAINLGAPGWDADTGHGVVNAAATYSRLLQSFA